MLLGRGVLLLINWLLGCIGIICAFVEGLFEFLRGLLQSPRSSRSSIVVNRSIKSGQLD